MVECFAVVLVFYCSNLCAILFYDFWLPFLSYLSKLQVERKTTITSKVTISAIFVVECLLCSSNAFITKK